MIFAKSLPRSTMKDSNINANDDANAPTTNPFKRLKSESDGSENRVNNVTLVGCDGGRVMATKSILASHSPFFHQMFYGDFQEADNSCELVNFDWSSATLSIIVKYCHAGEWPSESFFCENQNSWLEALGSNNDEKAVALLWVREAANYFGLTKLHGDITAILKLRRDPSTDFFVRQFPGDSPIDFFKINLVVLEELEKSGETTGDLWDACQEKRWELAKSITYSKQRLDFFQEFQKWGRSDEYRWSSEVGYKALPIACLYQEKNELVLYGDTSTETNHFRTLDGKSYLSDEDKQHVWPTVFAKAISDTQKVMSILCSVADDTSEFRKKFIDEEVVPYFDRNLFRMVEMDTFPFGLVVNLRMFKKALEPCSREEDDIFQNIADSINLNTSRYEDESDESPVYCLMKPCSLFPRKRWDDVGLFKAHPYY